MKRLKGFSVAALILLSVLWHCSADPLSGGTTNTAAPKFYFVGGDGVLKPARFVFHEGITLTNAIRRAGGFIRHARTNKVELIRTGQRAALEIDVTKIEKGENADVKIEAGDYILVRGAKVLRQVLDRRPDR